MNIILYVIPWIAVVAILAIRHKEKINKKSILVSLGILVAAIVVAFVLPYFSRIVYSVANSAALLIGTAILIDVILQSVIIFAETVLFKKVFCIDGKIRIWTYIILVCCIIFSTILYYIDYADMFVDLKNGIDSISILQLFAMNQARFAGLRRVLAIIPSIDVIVESFVIKGKKE